MKNSKKAAAYVIGLAVVAVVGGVFLYQKATGDLRAHDDFQARLRDVEATGSRIRAETAKLAK